jgi:hypothetical protein
MTVYWCDPYLHTSNGGIHGTTSSGSGTYAAPWNLTDLVNATSTTFVDNDELRFKGLTEDSQFDVRHDWDYISSNYMRVASDDQYKLVRYQNRLGTEGYTGTYYRELKTVQGCSTWNRPHLDPDTTYGYYPILAQYQITSGGNYRCLQNINRLTLLTITSGWTSETVQGGVTILAFKNSNIISIGAHCNTTSSSSSYISKLNIDCFDRLIINGARNGGDYGILRANRIQAKAITGSTYASSANDGYHMHVQEKLKARCMGTSGYMHVYMYPSEDNTNAFEVDYLSTGYQNYCYFYNSDSYNVYSTGAKMTINMKLRDVCVESNYYLQWNNGNPASTGSYLNFELLDGWQTQYKSNGLYLNSSYWTNSPSPFSETIGTKSTIVPTWTNNLNAGQMSSSYPSNRTAITSGAGYDAQYGASFFKNFSNSYNHTKPLVFTQLQNTVPLESLEYMNYTQSSAGTYGNHVHYGVVRDALSYRPLQMIGPTTSGGKLAYVYNSNDFNGKMVWHFVEGCAGTTYASIFPVDLPDYTSSNLTLTASFDKTASKTIATKLRLYASSPVNGQTMIRDLDVTWSGDTASVSEVLTTAELTSGTVASIYAVVDATPDAAQTGIAVLAIGSIAVT